MLLFVVLLDMVTNGVGEQIFFVIVQEITYFMCVCI